MELYANRVKPQAVRVFGKQFKCKWPGCSLNFTTAEAYKQHIVNHRATSFACLLCNCYFKSEDAYLEHTQTKEHLSQGRRKRARAQSNDVSSQLQSPHQHPENTPQNVILPQSLFEEYEDFIPNSAVEELEMHLDHLLESQQQTTRTVAPAPLPPIIQPNSIDQMDDDDSDDENNISLTYHKDIQQYLSYTPHKQTSIDIKRVVDSLNTAKKTPHYPYDNQETLEFVQLIDKYPIPEEGIDAWLSWLKNKTTLPLPSNVQQLRAQQSKIPEIFDQTQVWFNPPKMVYHIDFELVLLRLLNDKELYSKMVFEPVKHINSAGKRVYSELYTGKWWEIMFERLPTDVNGRKPKPIVFILENDKTHLNRTGTHFADPNIITLGNFPQEIQQQAKARQVVSYSASLENSDIPVKSHRSFCRYLLTHHCWRALLEIFERASKQNGLFLSTAIDSTPQWFYPVLGPFRCDLQTAYRVACQFGSNFEKLQRGCNNCNIPGSDLGHIGEKPLANDLADDKLIEEAIQKLQSSNRHHAAEAKKKLQEHSLHPVRSAFAKQKEFFNSRMSVLFDIDHLVEGIGKDMINCLNQWITEHCGREASAVRRKIDQHFARNSKHHLPNEEHFPNGIFDLNLNQQKTIIAVLRELPYCLHGSFSDKDSENLMIETFQLWNQYWSFCVLDEFSEDTIEEFVAVAKRLQQFLKLVFPFENWGGKPKYHKLSAHIRQMIELFGRLKMGSTQILERDHQQNAKILYQFSSHKDFVPQFCNKIKIRFLNDWCRPSTLQTQKPKSYHSGTFTGKSTHRSIRTLKQQTYPNIDRLGSVLHEFLTQCHPQEFGHMPLEELELKPINVYSGCVPLQPNIPAKAMPKYHGRQRFDTVQFLDHCSVETYGKLLLVFQYSASKAVHQLAFIQKYSTTSPDPVVTLLGTRLKLTNDVMIVPIGHIMKTVAVRKDFQTKGSIFILNR
mmetsp:Transcript_11421/g.15848  ORF Transcript_11421/g.15848 Transcript_11421/m.15848 type:complete len:956 (+) Transcript_11421:993-3860(+)